MKLKLGILQLCFLKFKDKVLQAKRNSLLKESRLARSLCNFVRVCPSPWNQLKILPRDLNWSQWHDEIKALLRKYFSDYKSESHDVHTRKICQTHENESRHWVWNKGHCCNLRIRDSNFEITGTWGIVKIEEWIGFLGKSLMKTGVKNFEYWVKQVGVSVKINKKAFSIRIVLQKTA